MKFFSIKLLSVNNERKIRSEKTVKMAYKTYQNDTLQLGFKNSFYSRIEYKIILEKDQKISNFYVVLLDFEAYLGER